MELSTVSVTRLGTVQQLSEARVAHKIRAIMFLVMSPDHVVVEITGYHADLRIPRRRRVREGARMVFVMDAHLQEAVTRTQMHAHRYGLLRVPGYRKYFTAPALWVDALLEDLAALVGSFSMASCGGAQPPDDAVHNEASAMTRRINSASQQRLDRVAQIRAQSAALLAEHRAAIDELLHASDHELAARRNAAGEEYQRRWCALQASMDEASAEYEKASSIVHRYVRITGAGVVSD